MPWDIIDLDINTDPWGTEAAGTASVIFPLTIPYQKKKKQNRKDFKPMTKRKLVLKLIIKK